MPEEAKLHIGNLSYDATERDLRHQFEKYGVVEEVNIIKDRDTGKPRGYAFVMFENVDDAKDAMRALYDKEICGRCIKVEKANPLRRDGGGRSYNGGGRSYGGGGGGGRSYGGGGRSYGGRSDSYNDDRRSYGGRDYQRSGGGYDRDQGRRGDRYGGGGGGRSYERY